MLAFTVAIVILGCVAIDIVVVREAVFHLSLGSKPEQGGEFELTKTRK